MSDWNLFCTGGQLLGIFDELAKQETDSIIIIIIIIILFAQ